MPIVQVKSFLQNKWEKKEPFFCGKGLLKENILSFNENDIKNELNFKNDKLILRRKLKNEEFYFTFIEKENTKIEYTSSMGTLEIPLYTEKIVKEKNKIEIDYIVDGSEAIKFTIVFEL